MSIERGCALVFRCRNGFPRLPSPSDGVPHRLREGHEPRSAQLHRHTRSAMEVTSARPQHLTATRRPLQHIQRLLPCPFLACHRVVRPPSTTRAMPNRWPQFPIGRACPPILPPGRSFRYLFGIPLGCHSCQVSMCVGARNVRRPALVLMPVADSIRHWPEPARPPTRPAPYCLYQICI
jgi:hypothetical protein